MNDFAALGLSEPILKAIGELGFETPTPIQEKTIPHLLSTGEDVIAFAQTGTGKTAAFGLPAVQLAEVEDKDPQTLVLCPTRELCLQINRDLTQFAKYIKGLHVVAVYGGASISGQIKDLRRGAQIVVGTPGRVRDLIKRGKLRLGQLRRVILDEADEMLSMGFKEELDDILSNTPEEKQTLLFSATMSKAMNSMTKTYMKSPVEFSVARKNIGAENVEHFFYMVPARERYEVLKRIADMNPDIYGIVFCRTRRDTKDIARKLMEDGYNADALHGDLSQAQRDEVMERFRSRQLQMLVATDVAARGLDVKALTHVINYNLPDDFESYIHRSGRTGRAGESGISIAIVHSREGRKIRELEKRNGITFTKAMVPTGEEICRTQLYALIDKIKDVKVNDEQIAPFMPAINEKLEGLDREAIIKHFVSAEFNRFLSYYQGAPDLNKGGSQRKMRDSQPKQSKEERRRGVKFSNIYVNVGTKQGLNPGRLIGLVNNALDSGDAKIGRIELMKRFSFFEIEEGKKEQVVQALTGAKFEGTDILAEVSTAPLPPPQDRRDRKGFKGKGGRDRKSRDRKPSWKGRKGAAKGGYKKKRYDRD